MKTSEFGTTDRGVGLGGRSTTGAGLSVERYFTKPDVDPFTSVSWERRKAELKSENGKTIFVMEDVEVPTSWSQLAVDIAADKYFRKAGVPNQGCEKSVRDLVGRVANAVAKAGEKLGGYFATSEDVRAFRDELVYMLVNQMAAFNSPVWFNVGLAESYGITGKPSGNFFWDPKTGQVRETDDSYSNPAASACFIVSVEDDLLDIARHVEREMRIFRFGGGSGGNYSRLRAEGEPLSNGGVSSGLMSFLKVFDVSAGAIKSGGTCRRAAKLVCLDADHPDIEKFVDWKVREEDKAHALIKSGYPSDFNGEVYQTVSGQNANNSVRLTDEFMNAVLQDKPWETRWRTNGKVAKTLSAKKLFRKIAEAAWRCADPGLMFHTTINKWNPVFNTGEIEAANPCVEFHFLQNTACNLSSLNLMKFMAKKGGSWSFDVAAFRHAARIFTLAKEIIVDYASYPTREIAQNSHDFRPLGLGYANLGAALMVQGIPYDSEDGRAFAAAVNSVLCGAAYETSAQVASSKGPFAGFAHNREPMLRVISMHRDAAHKVETNRFHYIANAGRHAWDRAAELAEKYGVRNAQVTVTAPTGCLVPDTLVPTSRGLVPLGTLGDPEGSKWQTLDVEVSTDEGPRTATKFYVNGVTESVVTVRTDRGYELRGTPQHRVKVVTDEGEWAWRRIGELAEGDRVPLQLGQLVGEPIEVKLPEFSPPYLGRTDLPGHAPTRMTPDLAEFLGFFMSNGSLHQKGVRMSVCASDKDVVARLRELGSTIFGIEAHDSLEDGCYAVYFNSTRLVEWFRHCEFAKIGHETTGKGYEPRIPSAVLATNDRSIYAAFLRGLFEGDGTVSSGVPEFCSAYPVFISRVKSLLLALGYPTSSRVSNISEKSGKPNHRLRLGNVSFNRSWLDEVGFIGSRKRDVVQLESVQNGKCDRIPITEALLNRLAPVGHELRKQAWHAWSTNDAHSITRDLAKHLVEVGAGGREELGHLVGFYYDTIESTELGEIEPTFDLSVPCNVTYVANGFVSHNTIGLLMDCDTTGVEPDFSLVKHKKCAGGAALKIVNKSVSLALETLGYPSDQVEAIVKHVDKTGLAEGAPYLKTEHLPVFDCANKPTNGTRFIEPMGHVRMLEAVQPFVSGSISKTVNVPESTTVDEIERLYTEAWTRGLKCIAIYRDGSKHSQPLSTTKTKELPASGRIETVPRKESIEAPFGNAVVAEPQPVKPKAPSRSGEAPPVTTRHRLPYRRPGGVLQEVVIGGTKVYLRTGDYKNGRPGEIFLDVNKEGATMRSLMGCFSIAVSLGLQHGVPLEEYVDAFTHQKFEPAGPVVGHPNVKMSSSIVDAIFRILAVEYLGEAGLEFAQIKTPKTEAPPTPVVPVSGNGNGTAAHGSNGNGNGVAKAPKVEGNLCGRCGGLLQRSGSCEVCTSCATTTGCS